MKFSINTLGCKVNLCESDEISGQLTGLGFQKVDYRDGNPHICIVNTCTVTSESDRKARQLIRKIRNINKKAKLAVTGCYVRDHSDFLKKSGADLILDNDNKKDVPGLVESILKKTGYQPGTERPANTDSDLYGKHSRPIVKIQDGCEQNCTYCIIPRVRGKYRSADRGRITERIKKLAEGGFEEVVLTGIHIGKYGFNMGGDYGLADLLQDIFLKSGIKRIRISSLEINEIDSRLLDIMQEHLQRVAPHLHIPLQSGSDDVLKRMGRPYDSGSFIRGIKKIKEKFPHIALTTDVMAGFPGETDKDFQKTLEIIREINFSKLHVFKYSPRPGTRAFLFKDSVAGQVKYERSRVLRELGEKMRDVFMESNKNTELAVAVEKKENKSVLLSGTSGNYIRVYFETDLDFEKIRGKLIKIRAGKKYRDGLLGSQNT